MKKVIIVIVLVLAVGALFAVTKNRASRPEDSIEQAKTYIRNGEFDKMWTLYSLEFREELTQQVEELKAALKKEIAKGSDWINDWIWRQVHATPQEFLKLTPREIDARRTEVDAKRILAQKTVDVSIEGETAIVVVEREKGAPLSEMTFILRDGKWLIWSSSFQPMK